MQKKSCSIAFDDKKKAFWIVLWMHKIWLLLKPNHLSNRFTIFFISAFIFAQWMLYSIECTLNLHIPKIVAIFLNLYVRIFLKFVDFFELWKLNKFVMVFCGFCSLYSSIHWFSTEEEKFQMKSRKEIFYWNFMLHISQGFEILFEILWIDIESRDSRTVKSSLMKCFWVTWVGEYLKCWKFCYFEE